MIGKIYKNKLILDIHWISTLKGNMGIIKVKDIHTDEIKILLEISEGLDEWEDTKSIINTGYKITSLIKQMLQ